MKPDISELLELAKKATPGPWRVNPKEYSDMKGLFYVDVNNTQDAQYIAALSPDKMIALLEYVEELERVISAGYGKECCEKNLDEAVDIMHTVIEAYHSQECYEARGKAKAFLKKMEKK